MNKKNYDYKNYWNKNVEEWGNLYLEISHGHESFHCSKFLGILYNKFIIPIEANLMKVRYQKTMNFIDKYVSKNITVSDIGCGTGIFAVHCLKKGARVNLIDISESSLNITRHNICVEVPDSQKKTSYYLMDAQKCQLPKSEVSIAVGVLPYIEDVEAFFSNALSQTDILFCQFSSSHNPFNWLRRYCKFLNVRNLQFQSKDECKEISARHGFEMVECERFATGYLMILQRVK